MGNKMKLITPLVVVVTLWFSAVAAIAGGTHHHPTISISDVTARMLMRNRPISVYMTVRNDGVEADKILSAASPMAKRVEVHTHLMENGIMKMRHVAGGVDIPTKSDVAFESGGLHLMVFGLDKGLQKGDEFPLKIMFEKAGMIEIKARLQGMKPMKHGDHSGHDMKNNIKMKHGEHSGHTSN